MTELRTRWIPGVELWPTDYRPKDKTRRATPESNSTKTPAVLRLETSKFTAKRHGRKGTPVKVKLRPLEAMKFGSTSVAMLRALAETGGMLYSWQIESAVILNGFEGLHRGTVTNRLRHMVSCGLVNRTDDPELLAYQYRITPRGLEYLQVRR